MTQFITFEEDHGGIVNTESLQKTFERFFQLALARNLSFSLWAKL